MLKIMKQKKCHMMSIFFFHLEKKMILKTELEEDVELEKELTKLKKKLEKGVESVDVNWVSSKIPNIECYRGFQGLGLCMLAPIIAAPLYSILDEHKYGEHFLFNNTELSNLSKNSQSFNLKEPIDRFIDSVACNITDIFKLTDYSPNPILYIFKTFTKLFFPVLQPEIVETETTKSAFKHIVKKRALHYLVFFSSIFSNKYLIKKFNIATAQEQTMEFNSDQNFNLRWYIAKNGSNFYLVFPKDDKDIFIPKPKEGAKYDVICAFYEAQLLTKKLLSFNEKDIKKGTISMSDLSSNNRYFELTPFPNQYCIDYPQISYFDSDSLWISQKAVKKSHKDMLFDIDYFSKMLHNSFCSFPNFISIFFPVVVFDDQRYKSFFEYRVDVLKNITNPDHFRSFLWNAYITSRILIPLLAEAFRNINNPKDSYPFIHDALRTVITGSNPLLPIEPLMNYFTNIFLKHYKDKNDEFYNKLKKYYDQIFGDNIKQFPEDAPLIKLEGKISLSYAIKKLEKALYNLSEHISMTKSNYDYNENAKYSSAFKKEILRVASSGIEQLIY